MTTIKIAGAAQGFNWLPVFVAEKQGYLEEAGLALELQKLGSVDKATAAVVDGSADVAITPPEGAVADVVSGGGLRIIAANSNRLPMSLIARPGITRFEDLRGAKIGTSSLTEGTAIYTQIMLAEHGLAYPGDYDFALAGIHTTRWEALQKGEIDAAPQPAPWNFMATRAGYTSLGEVSDAIPEIVFAALIAHQRWLDASDDAVSLLRALRRAHAFVNDPANEDACVDQFQSLTTKDDPELARRGFVYMRDLGMWPTDMGIPSTAYATTLDMMVRTNLLRDDDRSQAQRALALQYLEEASR